MAEKRFINAIKYNKLEQYKNYENNESFNLCTDQSTYYQIACLLTLKKMIKNPDADFNNEIDKALSFLEYFRIKDSPAIPKETAFLIDLCKKNSWKTQNEFREKSDEFLADEGLFLNADIKSKFKTIIEKYTIEYDPNEAQKADIVSCIDATIAAESVKMKADIKRKMDRLTVRNTALVSMLQKKWGELGDGFPKASNLVEKIFIQMDVLEEIMRFEDYADEIDDLFTSEIGEAFKTEMRGIAEGAGIPYSQVLIVNSFMEVFPGTYGCSAVAHIKDSDKRVFSTNFPAITDQLFNKEVKCERYLALKAAKLDGSTKAYERALQAVNVKDSIQSIIFDPAKKSIRIARSWEDAGTTKYEDIPSRMLFSSPVAKAADEAESQTTLGRLLDWSSPVLGPKTMIFVHTSETGREVSNVSWPGYLGCLSGMNSSGLSHAVCQSGEKKQKGKPTLLILKKMLENCDTVAEGVNFLKQNAPASAMNITLASVTDIGKLEILPKGPRDSVVINLPKAKPYEWIVKSVRCV